MECTGHQMQGMARGMTVAVMIDELEVREESNPRRVRPTLAEDAAMHASIRGTGGPLQNLIGWRDESTGTIVVTGGARRLAATRAAIEEGEIAPDIVIPVRVMENERAAMAAGLAENTVRAPMHWVDEVVAFRSLQSTQGWNERQIAMHFGVSTRRVREKLRLGGLCEGALGLARGEQLAPDEMRALSAVGSQERQEEIIAEIQKAPENEWGNGCEHESRRSQCVETTGAQGSSESRHGANKGGRSPVICSPKTTTSGCGKTPRSWKA